MPQTDVTPSAGHAITIRLRLDNTAGTLARVTTAIGEAGGNIGAIDLIRANRDALVRDITIATRGDAHAQEIVERVRHIDGVEFVNVSDRTFLMHLGGKIEVRSKVKIKTREQLSRAYTPGVARVSTAIHLDPEKAYTLTTKGNTVAVVTDGTAVLGLGDIGPKAALPVMEGKAMLFKDFAGLNAFPICLDTTDPDEIIRAVQLIAPGFGGINLEDISAPRCFEIEARLQETLDIPVFHDDQHGTAVVVTAALLNALRLVGKQPADLKVVVCGVGAAGTAIARMLALTGVENIVGTDKGGILSRDRTDLNAEQRAFAELTNPEGVVDSVHEAVRGADVFIGVSAPNVIGVDDLKRMAAEPIVFAMANPTPEIMPELAWPHVAVMATGRSDYPNQINNVLCFPGIFKGALAVRARQINEAMKMAAAEAIAGTVEPDALSPDYIIPSVFDRRVVERVATAVGDAARRTGVARKS